MPVKLYSHDDAGAPVLATTNDGSLLTLLRACLVDGYGTRSAAGWTMPFSDLPNRVGCFKPVNDAVFLRLDDNYSYQYAYIRGYENMTDANTGTYPFPRDEDLTSGHKVLAAKRQSTIAADAEWHVLADDDWFIFISHHVSQSNTGGMFFGRITHADTALTDPHLITGYSSASSMSASQFPHTLFTATSGTWWMKEIYTKIRIPARVKNIFEVTNYVNPNPISGKIDVGVELLTSFASPNVFYGKFPNRFRALGSSVIIYNSGTKIVSETIKYLVVRHSTFTYLFSYDVEVG